MERGVYLLSAMMLLTTSIPTAFGFGHNPEPMPRATPDGADANYGLTTRAAGQVLVRGGEAVPRHNLLIDIDYMRKNQYREIIIKEGDNLELIRREKEIVIKQK